MTVNNNIKYFNIDADNAKIVVNEKDGMTCKKLNVFLKNHQHTLIRQEDTPTETLELLKSIETKWLANNTGIVNKLCDFSHRILTGKSLSSIRRENLNILSLILRERETIQRHIFNDKKSLNLNAPSDTRLYIVRTDKENKSLEKGTVFNITKEASKKTSKIKSIFYTVSQSLGKGGSGEVNLLKPFREVGKSKAIKIAHADANDFEEAYAKHRALLTDPSTNKIIKVPGLLKAPKVLIELDGRKAIIMSLGEGQPRGCRLPDVAALQTQITNLVTGMDYMHNQKNFAHRDLKSDNLVMKNGNWEIIDFNSMLDLNGTNNDSFVGTAAYTCFNDIAQMPQSKEELEAWYKARDVFALGIALKEILISDKIINDHKVNAKIAESCGRAGLQHLKNMSKEDIILFDTKTLQPAEEDKLGKIIDLLNKMTDNDYKQRPTFSQAKQTLDNLNNYKNITIIKGVVA